MSVLMFSPERGGGGGGCWVQVCVRFEIDFLRLGRYGSSSLEIEIAFKIGFEFQLGFGLIFSQGG